MRFKPSRQDRPTFGKLADEYGLTYFGTVIPSEENDYVPVRGLTASPEQVDDNYTNGIVAGYEVQLLQRSHDIFTPDNRQLYRTWTVCCVKLHKAELVHVLLSGLNKDNADGSLFASYLRMNEIDMSSLGDSAIEQFKRAFALYISPSDIAEFERVMTRELQIMLSAHFAGVDFEFDGSNIYIYCVESPLQLVSLDKMLRIIVWLAKYIDSHNA